MNTEDIQKLLDEQRRLRELNGGRLDQPGWIERKIAGQVLSNDQSYSNRMSIINRTIWQNPDTVEKMSETYKEKWQDEDYREKMCQMAKELQQNEEHRKRVSESCQKVWTEEKKQQASERVEQLWKDEEFAKKMKNRKTRTKCSVIGTNIQTGETIHLTGMEEMANAGFVFKYVKKCLDGKSESYKGYTWSRVNDE